MYLRNMSRRLITVNTPSGGKFRILPGDNPSVEVSKEALETDFVKHLLSTGELIIDANHMLNNDNSDDEELANLQAEAFMLGIEYKDTWKASTLQKKIDEHKQAS